MAEEITISFASEEITVNSDGDTLTVSASSIVDGGLTTPGRLSKTKIAGSLEDSQIADAVAGGVLSLTGTYTADRSFTLPDQDVSISVFGASLIDDADASAARATLGFTDPILDKASPGAIGATTRDAIGCTTLDATTHVRVGSTAGVEAFEVDSGSDANVAVFSSDATFSEFQMLPGDGAVDMVRIRAGNDGVGRFFATNSVDILDFHATGVDVNGDLTADSINFGQDDLDYYDEGTFTPTIAGSTTAGTQTYSVQQGTYTRVGDTVHCFIRLVMTAKDGATSGALELRGLPFTSDGGSRYGGSGTFSFFTINTGSGYSWIGGKMVGGFAVISLQEMGSNLSAANLTEVDLNSNSGVEMSITYKVA